jgi:hypothetical protein
MAAPPTAPVVIIGCFVTFNSPDPASSLRCHASHRADSILPVRPGRTNAGNWKRTWGYTPKSRLGMKGSCSQCSHPGPFIGPRWLRIMILTNGQLFNDGLGGFPGEMSKSQIWRKNPPPDVEGAGRWDDPWVGSSDLTYYARERGTSGQLESTLYFLYLFAPSLPGWLVLLRS